METKALDRNSAEAREMARTPVGRTWINADALEQVKRMGTRWVRRNPWAGEGRGAFGILELRNWHFHRDGLDELSELILAITVNDMQDLGREPWVEYGGAKHYIGRYQYSGLVYYLRDDDDSGLDRPMPAGAVPIEDVLSLPNLVFVAGLRTKTRKAK